MPSIEYMSLTIDWRRVPLSHRECDWKNLSFRIFYAVNARLGRGALSSGLAGGAGNVVCKNVEHVQAPLAWCTTVQFSVAQRDAGQLEVVPGQFMRTSSITSSPSAPVSSVFHVRPIP